MKLRLLLALMALLAGCAEGAGNASPQPVRLPLAADRPTFLLFFTDP